MEQQFETKILKIQASAVRKGDAWTEAGREGIVGEVKVGTKNTTITSESGRRLAYIPSTTEVVVARDVETDESKEARFREARNQRVEDWYAEYEERRHTKAAFKKMDEILGNEGALVDGYRVGQFIAAQAEDKVEAKIYRSITVYKRRVAEGEDTKARDLIELVEMLADEAKDELVSIRALSRSTSVVDNIMEDAENAAKAEFARKHYFGWF
jgi:hypothetical protein